MVKPCILTYNAVHKRPMIGVVGGSQRGEAPTKGVQKSEPGGKIDCQCNCNIPIAHGASSYGGKVGAEREGGRSAGQDEGGAEDAGVKVLRGEEGDTAMIALAAGCGSAAKSSDVFGRLAAAIVISLYKTQTNRNKNKQCNGFNSNCRSKYSLNSSQAATQVIQPRVKAQVHTIAHAEVHASHSCEASRLDCPNCDQLLYSDNNSNCKEATNLHGGCSGYTSEVAVGGVQGISSRDFPVFLRHRQTKLHRQHTVNTVLHVARSRL